ncbi:MAG TPA: M14 family metallocarboxypeptidase [Pseudidiomarina sp.]|nr:M14 family metallocarboxypeptidase [Pseudidiomarina sp.]
MTEAFVYHIGTEGQPWGTEEKQRWLSEQHKKRSYVDDVVTAVKALADHFSVERYGRLDYTVGSYDLLVVKTRSWQSELPTIVVTGGVHGYETSGVHGALRFLQTVAPEYEDKFNIVVFPCLSPWGYETINRWNPTATDPNRSFKVGSGVLESELPMKFLAQLQEPILMHVDLHETTDSDNSEFRPALAARDGKVNTNWNIPDGFYLVGDADRPEAAFQGAIIRSVETITHIAEPDDHGQFIGVPMEQVGVINYSARPLGLCMGMTAARYVTTTEVYPDSPRTNPEECIAAQVAAITGGLNYILNSSE